MRLSAAVALCALCTIAFAADPAHASIRRDTNIPAEGLGPALETLAKDYDFQVLYRTEIVKDRKTQGVVGSLTSDEALTKVLSGTGLSYKYLDASTVTIVPVALITDGAVTDQAQTSSSKTQDNSKEAGKNSSQDFRVAQVDQANAGPQVASNSQNQTNNQSGGPALVEIIVTAQKKSERLQDVPVPVTVLSAQTLADSNQLRLQDYFTSVPGLSVVPYETNGTPALVIRGVTTGGFSNPTVGITVDDVPYGSSTALGGGAPAPDIDPSDLASIEVLRGPQGTLYGASSMGGLLKFVTVDPSTDSVSGRVQAGTSQVRNGDELGYNVRGSINVPLSDTVAVRASGFTRQDPGYIDNVETGQSGINKTEVYGGRLSALWRPSEDLSLKLSALYQGTRSDGSSFVDVEPGPGYLQCGAGGLGDLQQCAVKGTGASRRSIQAYSAILKAKLGSADLAVLSGYSVDAYRDSFDFTPYLGPYTLNGVPGTGFNGFGVLGTPLLEDFRTSKFNQEIRLSIPFGKKVDWLIGGFYTHENSPNLQETVAANPTTGVVVGEWDTDYFPTTLTEYAAFTDLTFHFTDRFNVQVGGRESQLRQSYTETYTGIYDPVIFGLPSPVVNPLIHTRDSAFTYLVTPQLKISPDLMVYARLASGYRAGGPNPTSSLFGLPSTYKPDKTENYELGVKGDVLAHRLSFDASLYYIRWKDIQLSLIDAANNQAYFANGGGAKSQGIELSTEARPLEGLTITAWVAYNDAVLTQGLPSNSQVYGASGDRLPSAARISGNFSLEQEFHITSTVTGFAGGQVSYIGDRLGQFTSPPPAVPPRQDLPGFAQTDFRAGARYQSWTVNIFVNNVADKRGVLAGGLGSLFPFAFNYIQPRTVGLNVVTTF